MAVSISIIVPAHNEGLHIAKCLSAIEKCQSVYAGQTEIIVVDNNSSDNTYQVASTFAVKLIQSNATTPAKVRNDGAALANNEILAFVDGDCVITPQWLDLINTAYQDEVVGAYGGQHIAPTEDNCIVTSWNPTSLKASFNTQAKLPGGNFSIRANLFAQIGGFNEALTSAEDDHLSKQVMLAGYQCVLDSKNFIVHWGYPKTLRAVFAKQKWHGKTQIKAHGFLGDKLVLVTYAWLLSFIALAFAYFFENSMMQFFAFSGVLACPLVIMLNRLRYHHTINFIKVPVAYLVAVFFILGRLSGLVLEFVDIAKKRDVVK